MAGNISISSPAHPLLYGGDYGPAEGAKQAKVMSRDAVPRGNEGTEAPAEAPDKQAVSYLVDALKNMSRVVDRNLEFEVDESSGRIIIRVTDGKTGELIREIPPEEMRPSSRDSLGQLVGLLFDDIS